jgi:hypothetical protein
MKTIFSFIALIIFSSLANALPSPIYHSPSSGNNYIAYDLLKTGPDAESYCLSKTGHLAVINNHSEALELFTFMGLLLPVGPITDQDFNYTLGEYIAANSTIQKNVITQFFYTDPAFSNGSYYYNFDGSPVNYKRYLQLDSLNLGLNYIDLTTTTRKFICEFEDAPI